MGDFPEPLDLDYSHLTVNDFIVEMHQVADKQEKHPAFQGKLPDYVTRPPKLREMADNLGKARDAAAGGDKNLKEAFHALWAACKLALNMNAKHLIMVSIVRNDQKLLDNGGYAFKQRTYKTSITLLDLVPELFLKHGDISGCLILMVKRAKSNAAFHLQMTDKDPAVEENWGNQGTFSRSRLERKGYEPASKVWFRARYVEDGGEGKWSKPVGIIVL